jgi:broad specificity phosphatase PhoE
MEKREEKVRNKFRFFRKLARRRDTPHDMDDLVDLLDSDDDITPKVNETSLDVQERNEEMFDKREEEESGKRASFVRKKETSSSSLSKVVEEDGEGQDTERNTRANDDNEETVSMLKRGAVIADPLDPQNWEAYSPKSSTEGERKDAFTSLNADDEYFRRTGGTKPPPPPIESNRAKSMSISGVTRHVLDATSDVVKVSKESEKQQLVGNNRVGPAAPKQEVRDSVNNSNGEKQPSSAETISQRTIRYPEQDMIAAQKNIPNPGVSSPPRPSSLEKGMKPTASFMKLSIEENPTPQTIPPPIYGDQGNIGEKHVLVMVGLPARGKTHMAKRLCQYLRFFHGANTKVFNVGEYRRKVYGAGKMTHVLFDSQHEKEREVLARAAMKDMIDFLFQEDSVSYLEQRGVDSGRVAIFDATNSTKARRQWLVDQMGPLPVKLLFVESVCNDEDIITNNIWEAKVTNADYVTNEDKQAAYDDFRQRIREYERRYETMDEDNLSFIKLIDCGKRVEINRIHGYLLGRIVQFLSNLHAHTTSIYLSRHGQSEYNASGKIGGDSCLTAMGEAYAKRLGDYANDVIGRNPETDKAQPVRLWTSALQRTQLTARHIPHPKILTSDGKIWTQMAPRVLRNLDEIYAGVCDGMTYEEIKEAYPEEYLLRQENKLGYRYPRGESYLDVISRLDPLIQELESYREPVVIVGHQGVLRLIYAYFVGLDRTSASQGVIPLNTVIKLTPRTHDCIEERICLYNPAEDKDLVPSDNETSSSYASIADPPSY